MAVHAHRDEDGEITIWTDCEPGEIFSGRVIGHGKTLADAQHDARIELADDLKALDAISEADIQAQERATAGPWA